MPSLFGTNGDSALDGSARMQLTESSAAMPSFKQVALNVLDIDSHWRRFERVKEWHSLQRGVAPSTLAPRSCRLVSASCCEAESHLPDEQTGPDDSELEEEQPAAAASATITANQERDMRSSEGCQTRGARSA